MFLISSIRYLRGYVRFSAQGPHVERFLNLLARERIALWEVGRKGDALVACVAAGSYPGMRALAKKAGVRLRLTEKRGVPFKRKTLRRRRGLAVGFALAVLFLFGMSRFIWSVQIAQGLQGDSEHILTVLEEIGVRPGVLRSSIDVRDAERRALLALHEFSWVALNIDGSTVHFEAYETMPVPEVIDPADPCNVVATRDGQVLEMRVYSGQPVVGKGDAVLAGQVLVSGVVQGKLGQNMFRHARADVLAEVPLELTVRIPLHQTQYRPTGKTRTRNILRVFSWDLPLFLPLEIPRPYRAQREEYPLVAFGSQLPVSRRHEVYTLMEEVPVTLTEPQAREMAVRELAALEEAEIGDGEIVERTMAARVQGDEYILEARYVCHLQIGVGRAILQAEPE